MNELIHIGNADISVKEYNGQRVVTFKDIDTVHSRPDGTARRNFNTNKKRFKEGEDFFLVGSDEIRTSQSILQLLTRAIFIERVFSWGSKLESQ